MTDDPSITVDDEKGTVDQQIKNQILAIRSKIDDDERTLYVDRLSDPEYNLTIAQCNQFWGISVRQYLRAVKRLWNKDAPVNVDRVEQYWQTEKIGQVTLVPPDTDGYQFSLVEHRDSYRDMQLKRQIGISPHADLPEVKVQEFRGLQSVLNTNRVSATWLVTVDDSGPPPEHETVRVQSQQPIPKHILENAIEATDNFLQGAGIGLDITAQDYMADGEPGI